MDVVAQIEEVIAAHWELMGREPPARLHVDGPLTWFETPVRQLPYNGVIRTRLGDGPEDDAAIADRLGRFRARGAQCLWFTGPTSTPADLGARLTAHGLVVGEQTTYMSREAGDEPPAPALDVRLVGDDDLDAYTALTLAYWEVGDERDEVVALQQRLRPSRIPGRHRFLAFVDGRPAGKAFLSLAGPPGVAGIFGMSVPPELRGRGVASALTAALLRHARDEGCERVVLQSSDIALPVYERFGFVAHGEHPVFASAALVLGGH